MTIRAGGLDRRITLLRATRTDDGFQTVEDTEWPALATVGGSRKDISDGERGKAGSVLAEATTRFVIRYSTSVSSLNPKDRLTCDGETFAITGVKMIGRRAGLEITAARRSDD